MPEVRQPGGPFPERELERRDGRQRGAQPKDLLQFTGSAVGGDDALAEAV